MELGRVACCAVALALVYGARRRRRAALPAARLAPGLSRDDLGRYGRQMVLPSIGPEGQARVKRARVLVVGAGGLGSPVVALLAGAGVGTIVLADGDTVERSNLHRQQLHRDTDVGRLKTRSAQAYVVARNPQTVVEVVDAFVDVDNVSALVAGCDLVIEASDSLASKYLVSDACLLRGTPYIVGAAQGLEGQFALFLPGRACYRCVFPSPPPQAHRAGCSDTGVLGPVPSLLGSFQALVALQFLAAPSPQQPRQHEHEDLGAYFYMLDGQPPFALRRIKLVPRKGCAGCSTDARIRSVQDSRAFCEQHGLLGCSARAPSTPSMSWAELRLVKPGPLFVDVREAVQFRMWALEGALSIPLAELSDGVPRLVAAALREGASTVAVVCRRGVDSAAAVRELVSNSALSEAGLRVVNVRGGLEALPSPPYPRY